MLSVHLATHYSFFLALLSFSPWVASYKRPKGDMDMDVGVELAAGHYKGKTLDEILVLAESRAESRKESLQVPSGRNSNVLAQVLGFKFAYYQVRMFVGRLFRPGIFILHPVTRNQRGGTQKSLPHHCHSYTGRIYHLGGAPPSRALFLNCYTLYDFDRCNSCSPKTRSWRMFTMLILPRSSKK